MVEKGIHRPVLYGIGELQLCCACMLCSCVYLFLFFCNFLVDFVCFSGVSVKTGEVFPASFPHKGPAEELRSARTFSGGPVK